MAGSRRRWDTAPRLLLGGRRYVVLSEESYLDLLKTGAAPPASAASWAAWEKDAARLGQRLSQRRREAGLSQAELARSAGIRVETLNRIERGRTSPDFRTVRQLVLALAGGKAKSSAGRRRKEP